MAARRLQAAARRGWQRRSVASRQAPANQGAVNLARVAAAAKLQADDAARMAAAVAAKSLSLDLLLGSGRESGDACSLIFRTGDGGAAWAVWPTSHTNKPPQRGSVGLARRLERRSEAAAAEAGSAAAAAAARASSAAKKRVSYSLKRRSVDGWHDDDAEEEEEEE